MRAKTMHERLIEKHGILPLVVLALSLTGCAVSREVRTADGWINHVVSCGGPFLNIGHCLERAGRVCAGRGYQVLNKVGGELPDQPHAMPTGGVPDIPASFSQLKQYPGRKLLIRCN